MRVRFLPRAHMNIPEIAKTAINFLPHVETYPPNSPTPRAASVPHRSGRLLVGTPDMTRKILFSVLYPFVNFGSPDQLAGATVFPFGKGPFVDMLGGEFTPKNEVEKSIGRIGQSHYYWQAVHDALAQETVSSADPGNLTLIPLFERKNDFLVPLSRSERNKKQPVAYQVNFGGDGDIYTHIGRVIRSITPDDDATHHIAQECCDARSVINSLDFKHQHDAITAAMKAGKFHPLVRQELQIESVVYNRPLAWLKVLSAHMKYGGQGVGQADLKKAIRVYLQESKNVWANDPTQRQQYLSAVQESAQLFLTLYQKAAQASSYPYLEDHLQSTPISAALSSTI